MNLNDKLLNLRKKYGMSQEEVANKLNVSRQTISKWETGESKPDIDKIMPICELYKITPDELLTGNRSNTEPITNNKKKNAFVISISVLIYFIAVVWIIITDSTDVINENIAAGIFLLLCAIPTCILIYHFVSNDNNEKQIINIEDQKYKKIDNILSIITLIIYLLISFITSCWHITWIIWIVYVIVCEIVHTVLDMKEGNKND